MQFYLFELVKVLCWYVLVSGLGYLFFWNLFRKKFQHLYLYNQEPQEGDVRREFLYSISTVFILPIPTMLWFYFGLPYRVAYQNISDYGWAWFFVSFFVLAILHDAWFYWTHLLFHRTPILRDFHRVHHRSKAPTPFSGLAFHPVEAFSHGLFYPIVASFLPLHAIPFIGFAFFALMMACYGHLGFGIIPLRYFKYYPLRFLIDPAHHGHHHENPNGNFSNYFRHWDRWMNTWIGEIIKKPRP